jgi:uncharacterized repeat protein (TIGR03803 family)
MTVGRTSGSVLFAGNHTRRKPMSATCCIILSGLGSAILAAPAVAQTAGEAVLYAFQGGGDGENDESGLVIGSGGVIYGTTRDGGGGNCVDYWSSGAVVGCGTVFQLTPPATAGGAWSEKILHAFKGGADGAFPLTLTAGAGGVLYGTTGSGGIGASAGNGYGVVFQLTPPATAGGPWKETILYSFCAQSDCTDGANPGDGLLLAGGSLYGVTSYGGASGVGTVFKVTLATATSAERFATIYSFKGGSDGAVAFYGVIANKSGTLYGETNSGGGTGCGGNGCGTVYQLTPPSAAGQPYTEAVLHAFTGEPDGATPTGRLNLLSGGVLLGVAGGGGSVNFGAIYKLAPPATAGQAWTETILTNFGEGNLYGFPDSSYPNGNLVVGANGSIYGSSYGGGDTNTQIGFFYPGTIFELTPPIATGGPWVRSLLYSFEGGDDGLLPGWGLIAGPDGSLYGTTGAGGGTGCPAQAVNGMNIGCGTVFQFTP